MRSAMELLSGGNGGINSTIRNVAGLATAITLGLNAYTPIPENHVGVKTRNKKARKYRTDWFGHEKGTYITRGPGAHWTFPGVHSYSLVYTGINPTDLEPTTVLIKNAEGKIEKRTFRASIIWQVGSEGDNPYRAIFNVKKDDGDLTQHVTNSCLAGLVSVLQAAENGEEMMMNTEQLLTATRAHCADYIGHVGVDLQAVQLKETAPTEAETIGMRMVEASNNGPTLPPTVMGALAAFASDFEPPHLRAVDQGGAPPA